MPGQTQEISGAIAFRPRASAGVRRWTSRSVLLVAVALGVAACAGSPTKLATAEAFRDMKLLENRLEKGVSTQEDVRRILGAPTGSGAVFMASAQPKPQEMWFYQDIELTNIKASRSQLDLSVRQQILVVMLRDGIFDGFMWFSNDESATAWVKDGLWVKTGR